MQKNVPYLKTGFYFVRNMPGFESTPRSHSVWLWRRRTVWLQSGTVSGLWSCTVQPLNTCSRLQSHTTQIHEAAWCRLNSWHVTLDCTSGRGRQVIWFIATLARFAEFYPQQKLTHVWELYTSVLNIPDIFKIPKMPTISKIPIIIKISWRLCL